MQHDEAIRRLKVYISYDYADVNKAEELKDFFQKKGILTQCDITNYDTPEDKRVKLWAVKAIRSCDIFILILSHNSSGPKDWLKEMLRSEYAEAINFKKKIIYLCLDDLKNISPLISHKLSMLPEHAYLILPENNNNSINYKALLPVLNDLGCMIVGGNKTDSGKYNVSSTEEQNYDVFISYKSTDYEYARNVYDILRSCGLEVFFSRESLPKLGSAEYHKQIDIAIDRSIHMVIVATSRKHIESKWVEYEWRLFLGEKLAGRKDGNLITVLAEDLSVSDLPISLRNLEAIPLVRGEIERLIEYVKKESTEPVNKKAMVVKSDTHEQTININESEFSIFFEEGKAFKIGVRDLLSAPVDAIVNPTNSGLSFGGGLSAIISEQAGPDLDHECERIIKKIGKIKVTLAVPTKAGYLPFKGIIHAVGPRMMDDNAQIMLEKTIKNCLILADKKGWKSIAIPAISTGINGIPKKTCAAAFRNAVSLFWQENKGSSLNLVWLCLMENDFNIFKDILLPELTPGTVEVNGFEVIVRPVDNISWDSAVKYAMELRLGGYTDWRLPSRQLLDLIRKADILPIGRYFLDETDKAGEARYMSFEDGHLSVAPRDYNRSISAVFVRPKAQRRGSTS